MIKHMLAFTAVGSHTLSRRVVVGIVVLPSWFLLQMAPMQHAIQGTLAWIEDNDAVLVLLMHGSE